MKSHLLISLRMAAILAAITCGVYPLVVFAIAQTAFHQEANGSFVTLNGRIIGSELIGQSFGSERFFHSRPSAAGSKGYDARSSGGSNLGPTSRTLRDSVASRVHSFDVHEQVPADAATASASGLDPDVSPENALAQAARVARANDLSLPTVQSLIHKHTRGRMFGIYGEPRVNVLDLNLSLLRQR